MQRMAKWSAALLLLLVQELTPIRVHAQADGRHAACAGQDSLVWERTVRTLLEQPLWSDRTAYDALHFLMVPLHAAFEIGCPQWRAEFAAHFERFAKAGFDGPWTRANQAGRIQYAYLASDYLALAARSGDAASVPASLADLLYRTMRDVWERDTAYAWTRAFPGGVRERLLFELGRRDTSRSYFSAVQDAERFLFGVAADLKTYEGYGSRQLDWPAVAAILAAAKQTFDARVVRQPGGGWLFQPGAWTDHPDFAFAGQSQKRVGMSRAPVAGIAEDASHSFRMAGIVSSLALAYPPSDSLHDYYEGLRRGLARQFLTRALVPPSPDFPGFRLNNYMDGRNGVYRWQYRNRGADWGIGPYELSGSISFGWWALLADSNVQRVYRQIASSLPLPPVVLTLYAHGAPLRDSGDPKEVMRDSWANGLRYLLIRLASELPG